MYSYEQASVLFEKLFREELNRVEAQKFLVALYKEGETKEEIAAAAEVMRKHSIALPVSLELQEKLIDNCGTGGDKSGSFNVSTTVSFILSSCGCYVAKHGNRSVTSKSGSADVLETLGMNLHLNPLEQVQLLEETGFTFMFAQNHHPAMKYIMPLRKSLSHRTIFNVLGPLTNPAGTKKQLIGVFDKSFVTKMAHALKLNDSHAAYVVSSNDGMDEVSVSDVSFYARLKDGVITEGELDPQSYGIKRSTFAEIQGGDAVLNAEILKGVVDGSIRDAKRDIVLINAALALEVDGKVRDIQEGLEMAAEVIDNGDALKNLNHIIDVSNKI